MLTSVGAGPVHDALLLAMGMLVAHNVKRVLAMQSASCTKGR